MRSDATVLVIGAHPDDADIRAGGLAAKHAAAGNDVRFVSLTNGNAGHHELDRAEIEARRREEAAAAAEVIGIEYEVRDVPDGELEATLENRKAVIRLIRQVAPDLVLSHRPNDYHPDHRYGARLVQDAAYMVTVPTVCPDTPALDDNPVFAYLEDDFQKPAPFEPDVVVAIDDVLEEKVGMLHRHESQVYEWLPYTKDDLDEVPPAGDERGRRTWLEERWAPDWRETAEEYRERLIERYGEDRGRGIEHAEAFEVSEYGGELDGDDVDRLFPR